MGKPGPAPEITPEDALGVFAELEQPSTPLTATEVADEVECTRRTAHRKLDELAERGDLETKKPGAHSRVWWRPVTEQAGTGGESGTVPHEEFADFVRAVEDYAIFTLEPDGTVATWNAGARSIKGYEEAEIVGEHFSTFYTDEDTEASVPDRNLATAAEEGRVEDEGHRVRADGSRFWASVTITAIHSDDGELRGFTKVTRDMTERREHEEQLERERSRTEELVRSAPIPIAVQDENGETVMANERAQDALGLSEEDIREGVEDEDEWAAYDGDGRPLSSAEFAPVRAHASGEPVYDEEVAIERPDGERTWFSVNAVPFSGPDGEESGVVIAGEDITHLKVRQQELETELQEILGRVSDAFYALDDEFRFTHVNDHALEILQHSRDQLLGRHVWDVFPDQREGVYGRHLHEAMETQETVSFEVYEEEIDSWLEFTVYPSETGLSIYFQDVTERKHREQELTKYETIVETMNDGIYVKDEEGHFTMVNGAYAEMTGYAPEELVGEHASLVVDEAVVAESKASLSDGGAKPTVEASLQTADGDIVPAEGTFASLPTGEEVGVVRDVSRRKERERELERYGTIVETVDDGIYTVDDEGRFSMVNQAYAEMLGYDREELVGAQVTMVVDEDVAETAQEHEERMLGGEDAPPIEAELVTADGKHFPAEATFGLLPGDDPEYQRVGVVRDVSERVERERALEESERRYRTVIDNFPDGSVGMFDEDLEYTVVGGELMDRIDVDPEDRLDRSIREIHSEELLEELEPRFEAALDGESRTFEVEYRDRHLTVQTHPVRDADDEIFGGMVVVQDVTEEIEHRRERERYERIVENVPVGVYRNSPGPDGEFVEANEAVAEIFDADSLEELLSCDVSDLYVDPEERAEFSRCLEEDGVVRNYELEQETLDGRRIWISISAIRTVEDGEVYFDGIVQDVTERHEYEQELKTYEVLFTESRDVSGILTPDGTFEQLTPSASGVLGYEPDELVGENAFEYVHPEDRERVAAEYAKMVEDPDFEPNIEYRFRHGEGHWIYLESRGRNLLDDPDVDGIVVYSRDVTERRAREEELAERERQLSTLMDNVPGMVYRCRNERGWPMQFVSEGSFELTGYDPETMESGEVSYGGEVVHEDDREDLWEDVQQGIAEDGSFNVTYRLRTADGDVRWVRERGRGIYEDGDLSTVEGVIIDVTERKRAQERLAEERDMFAQGPAVVFQWEPDPDAGWPVEYVSENVEEVFGYPPEQLESGEIPYVDLLLDEELERIAREVEDAVAGGADRLTHDPYRVRTTDGGTKWVKDSTKIIRDDDGDVERLLGYLVDVTERKQRERELEDTKSRLEAAIDAGAVGTWEWDVQEDSMVANPSFAKTYGLDPDAVSDGVPIEQFTSAIHEDDRERVQEEIEEAVETCGEYEAEYRVWTADDELRWVVARGHVECDEDGNAATLPGTLTDITERKAYQRRIEESERRYRALIENFPDGAVGLFDEDLRYTAVGGQFLDQVDVSKEERIGERVTDIYPDDIIAEVEPHFEAALAGEHNSFHVRLHGRDLDATTLPVTDADGDIIAGMLVVQDVTERREAQRELRESEAKFRMIAENLEEIVWMASPDAEEFRYVNPAYEDVWGTDREELYEESLTFLDGVHPEDRDRVAGKFEELPDEDFDEEFRVVDPDGEVRWVHSRGAAVYDEDEDMTRIVGIGEDVTKRVERERYLEDRTRQQQALADVGQFALESDDLDAIMHEAASQVADVLDNDYCKVLDLDRDERELLLRQGVGWREGIVGSATVGADEDDSQAGYTLESEQPVVVDDLATDDRFGGPELLTSHDVTSGISTIVGPNDEPWGILGTHDTERTSHTREDVNFVQSVSNVLAGAIERHRYQRELEALVEQLEESNERLERFAYVASHDLQEPLRMISNYLQLLERRYRDELDEDAEEFIDFAVDGAERMREMISDLLAYSRLDTEAEPFEPTDAGEVVDNVLDDLHLRIEETDADVSVGELPTVQADKQQLEMVFQNLISNGLKYSGEEPPDIDVHARRRDDEWVFSVEDEGIGLDPDHSDDVFEVFNRLHTHEEYPGTGIGLAMCKKIVRRHGGDVWLESEPGEGATFSFSIPIDAADAEVLTRPGPVGALGGDPS